LPALRAYIHRPHGALALGQRVERHSQHPRDQLEPPAFLPVPDDLLARAVGIPGIRGKKPALLLLNPSDLIEFGIDYAKGLETFILLNEKNHIAVAQTSSGAATPLGILASMSEDIRANHTSTLDQRTTKPEHEQYFQSKPEVLPQRGDLVPATSHVWTAPCWQGKSLIIRGSRCANVSGLFVRRERRWPSSVSPRLSGERAGARTALWR